MKQLRDNGICVVVAKNPSTVRFLDPIPASSSRSQMEHAAIKLSRKLLAGHFGGKTDMDRGDITRLYVDMLVNGTSLDANGTKEEQDEKRREEIGWEEERKLIREEKKKEREAKLASSKPKPPTP